MRTIILGLFFTVLAFPAVGQANGILDSLSGIGQAVNTVGGIVNDVTGVLNIFGGGGSGGGTSTPTSSSDSGMFNPETVFPAWGDGGEVTGVIGSNQGALNQGDSRLIIYFIPKIIELMIWVIAPVITVLFMYVGLQFVWGGDREEEVTKARTFFRSAVLGLTFIVLSYSLMKAVFFILAI